jgi:hypothetical protein
MSDLLPTTVIRNFKALDNNDTVIECIELAHITTAGSATIIEDVSTSHVADLWTKIAGTNRGPKLLLLGIVISSTIVSIVVTKVYK